MKVILVDDELLALQYLERQLTKLGQIEVIGKFTDPIIGWKEILLNDVDVVFLDINLPECSGIELAEQLLEKRPHLNIVFVTAYNEYAVNAFELNAVDYIVKPVRLERLTKTIDRIRDRIGSKQDEAPQEDQSIRMILFRQVMIEESKETGLFNIMHWRTSKAQELFLYLLQHRGQLVRKSVLVDLLWPNFEMDKVYSQLYTTVYHIRKTLEPFEDRFQLINTTEGYILNIDQVILDVEEWEKGVIACSSSLSSETIDKYITMMDLYTGDYLQEYDYWWAEGERQRLKDLWLSTSYMIARWYEEQGLTDQAIASYLSICRQHPLEEQAYFLLMKIYDSLHNHLLVHRQYSLLTSALMSELGEQPSPNIMEWYKQWEKGTTVNGMT